MLSETSTCGTACRAVLHWDLLRRPTSRRVLLFVEVMVRKPTSQGLMLHGAGKEVGAY